MSEEKAASYVPQIKAAYGALLASHKKNLAHALTLGSLLNDAKTALGKKGKWTEWLAEYCPQISHRTANIYMKLAKHKDKFTDETNSQRAAIKALELDFGVGGGIALVNEEDDKEAGIERKVGKPRGMHAPKDGDESESLESSATIQSRKPASPDLAATLQNVGVDEVCTALTQAWDRAQLDDLFKRLGEHLRSLPTPLRHAPSAPAPQPN